MIKEQYFDPEAASRGATLLDADMPGWFHLVNLDTLNAQNPDKCPLAQVYGGYYEGLKRLFPETMFSAPEIATHGFCESRNNPFWREEVLARRDPLTVEKILSEQPVPA